MPRSKVLPLALPKTPRSFVRAACLFAALAWTTASAAGPSKQDVAKADKLFRDAKMLMGQNKFAEACPKLEESQSLDPAPGTKYQLAVCYENTGRPATALAYYVEIADLAKTAGYKDKEKVARDKAEALEPRVPRIVIEVPATAPSGMTIRRDGNAVEPSQYNRPILVDPGSITVEAEAPGKKPFRSTVVVQGEGTRVTVPVRLQSIEEEIKHDEAPPPPPPGLGAQRIAGIAVGAVGLGGVALGSVFGLQAKSAYDKAMGDPSLCPTKTACYPEGKKLVDTAQSDAMISTIAFAAGGVALAGGIILILTGAPKPQTPASDSAPPIATLVPVVTPGFTGVTATGHF
ncbi:MAG: hypothetical protein U0441_10410 [Polyangiaceae bacterium]